MDPGQPQESIEFGKYRLIRRIAVGGMAQIWLAVQRGPHGFEKTAVLKVILPDLCTNDEFVQMFLDEARLAAGLDHNNVVRIYDFGQINGQYYLAMEHLPGEDLGSIMQAAKRAQKPIPVNVACDMIVGAATGLHFAHELTDSKGRPLNVVHRDVSPSNIIVTYHGTVKLVDFGIARAETNITKTAAGTLKGKVAYVSPEQAAGEPIDRRSDVFALGTVLYEMLTLTRPFKRESDLATLKAVVGAPIAAPSSIRPEVPPDLDAIVLKAMERDLNARFQSAADLADALQGFLINQRYLRSERVLSDYMKTAFEEERRSGKLRIAQNVLEPTAKTPSHLQKLPEHLSPIRSSDSLPAVQVPGTIPAPGMATPAGNLVKPPTTTGSRPIIEGTLEPEGVDVSLKTTVEPTLARLERERKKRVVVAAAAIGGVLLIIVLAVVFSGGGDSPKKPDVVVKVDPPKDPVKPADPVKPVEPVKVADPVKDPVKPVEPVKVADPPKTDEPPKKAPVASKGKLTLDSTPWSEVFLKGRKLGDTPIVDLPLPAGFHSLTLVNDQKGLKQTIEVEITAGKTTVKKLKL